MEFLSYTFLFACFIAAVCDFLVYKIPNEIVLFIIALFVLKVFLMQPLKDFVWPLIVFSCVLVVGFGMYLMKWLGAGDAKLIAAVSLWMSQKNTFLFLILMSIMGGVLALIYLKFSPLIFAWQQKIISHAKGLPVLKGLMMFKETKMKTPSKVKSVSKKETLSIPYGVAIFMGAFITLLIEK